MRKIKVKGAMSRIAQIQDGIAEAESLLDTAELLLERAASKSGADFEDTMGKVEMLHWGADEALRLSN